MMDVSQAKALREPFAREVIGKLPKPYKKDSPRSQCRECGGYHGMPAVHLDYVGHAATTDRLLKVDPEWSWEPFATDERGLPAFDANRNLWIRLTVCGVTRIGVGDGMSLKECIGDAIRNAAMRFGVALDLWAKEDLHAMDTERGTAAVDGGTEPAQAPAPTRVMSRPKPATGTPTTITRDQQVKLHASLHDAGKGDRDAGLAYISDVLDREVDTTKTLTKGEASKVIDALTTLLEPAPTPPVPDGTEPTEEPSWN